MPGQESIGERVRELRLSKHFSQAQLAGAELSDSYISLIESGKRSPTPTVIRMLASRLGCTAEYLSEGVEPEERVHLQVLTRHADLALRDGDAERALAGYADVLDRSDDVDLAWRVHWGQAESLEHLGRVEEAISVLEELREEAEHDRGKAMWLPVVIALARCYRAAGDLGRTVALGDSAQARLGELGLLGGSDAADVGRSLILAHLDRGDLDKAQELAETLLAAADSDPTTAYRDASLHAMEDGTGAEALYLADQALATRVNGITVPAQARLRVASARALLAGNAAPTAAARALELLKAAEPILTGVDAAECRIEIARSQVLSGDSAAAVKLTRAVLNDLADRPEGVQEVVRARLMLGQALLAGADKNEALTVLHGTHAELDRLPMSRPTARLWREYGDLLGAAGDNVAMMAAYRLALEAAGLRPAPQHQDLVVDLH